MGAVRATDPAARAASCRRRRPSRAPGAAAASPAAPRTASRRPCVRRRVRDAALDPDLVDRVVPPRRERAHAVAGGHDLVEVATGTRRAAGPRRRPGRRRRRARRRGSCGSRRPSPRARPTTPGKVSGFGIAVERRRLPVRAQELHPAHGRPPGPGSARRSRGSCRTGSGDRDVGSDARLWSAKPADPGPARGRRSGRRRRPSPSTPRGRSRGRAAAGRARRGRRRCQRSR